MPRRFLNTLRNNLDHKVEPRRKSAHSDLIAEASRAGKVKQSLDPSGRSSTRRQSLVEWDGELRQGKVAGSGSWKKAGSGDLCPATREERVGGCLFLSLAGSNFKTRRRSEGG